MRCGGTPNLRSTPGTSSVSLLIVLTSVTFSLTSWAKSLSLVEMTVLNCCSLPRRARVAITSSASIPGISMIGHPSARTAS